MNEVNKIIDILFDLSWEIRKPKENECENSGVNFYEEIVEKINTLSDIK